MKNLFTYFAIALTGAVVLSAYSCKDEGTEPELKDIVLSPSTVIVEAADVLIGEDDILYIEPVAVAVTADHEWEIQSNPDWIEVTDVTATGFNLNIEPYGPENEAETREGEVVVVSVKGEWSIEVTQHRHDIVPVSAFEKHLGSYYLTADLVSAQDFNNEWGMGTYWSMDHGDEPFPGETVVIKDAIIINPNEYKEPEEVLVVEKVMQYEYGGFWMPFAFDAETETLSNILRTLDGGSVLMAFVYRKEEINGWICIPEGMVSAKLDENGEIVLPQTVNIDGIDETVYFMPTAGYNKDTPDAEVLPFSSDAMHNIKLVKSEE